jgi:hypothetical protein
LQADPGATAVARGDGKPELAEIVLHHLGEAPIVFDEEDARGHSGIPGFRIDVGRRAIVAAACREPGALKRPSLPAAAQPPAARLSWRRAELTLGID